MKKLITFIILSFLCLINSSCQRCDDEVKPRITNTSDISGIISAEINGIPTVFNNISLTQEGTERGDRSFTINATNSSNFLSFITIYIREGNLVPSTMDVTYSGQYNYTFIENEDALYRIESTPIVNIDNILKVTFSGQLAHYTQESGQYDVITFSNGKIDVLLTDLK